MIFISFAIETNLFTAEARRRGVKNLTKNSISQNGHIEINDEPYGLVQEFQVSEQLCFMDWKHPVDALQLENHCVFNNNVQTITTVK